MQHTSRVIQRVLLIAGIALPTIGFGLGHARAASSTDDTVIVVRDATHDSQCVYWYSNPNDAKPCPAGAVIWSYPVNRSTAEAAHYPYVMPQATDAETRRAIHKEVNALRAPLLAAVKSGGVTPDTCPPGGSTTNGGGHYLSVGGGLTIYYNWQLTFTGGTVGGQCAVTNIQDQTKATGSVGTYYWDNTQLDSSSISQDDYANRNCQQLTGSYTSWKGTDLWSWPFGSTSGNGTVYTNESASGSSCSPFDHYAYGTYVL